MPAKRIAIIGAGPAGLMAADVLSQYPHEVHVFEQKPSAARKFLMAGKTGLNISHAEPFNDFIQRYDRPGWLAPWIQRWDAPWIQRWMAGLGVQSYIGSSGRIFPVEMKAAPLLRAWLKRLAQQEIQFHYRHQCLNIQAGQVQLLDLPRQTIRLFIWTSMPLFWLAAQFPGHSWAVMANGSAGWSRSRLSHFNPAMPGC